MELAFKNKTSEQAKNFSWQLAAGIFFYVLILFGACFIKYYYHQYNGNDLAIFNQAFYNSSQGRWFVSSFNPPSYLGDHLALLMTALFPVYRLLPSALTLLFLQTLWLALAAWPLYLIARHYLSLNLARIVFFAWLLNPIVHSINLLEWHFISLLPFLIFWLWYFFIKDKFIPFIIFLGLILLVREDAAILAASFGLLMLFKKSINRRYLLYSLLTIVFSLAWFVTAVKLVSFFNISGSYKFLKQYYWLGDSWPGILLGLIKNPLIILKIFFNQHIFIYFLMLLLPLIFTPLFAPTYLIALAGPLTVLALGGEGFLSPFLHYNAWLLPAIFLSSIYGIKKIEERQILKKLKAPFNSVSQLLLIGILYSFVIYSQPLYLGIEAVYSKNKLSETKTAKEALLNLISPRASVLTSAEFISDLAQRERLYYLRYFFSDRFQYSEKKYELADNPDFIIFSPQDFLIYQDLSRALPPIYPDNSQKIASLIKASYGLEATADDYYLFSRQAGRRIDFYDVLSALPEEARPETIDSNRLALLAWRLEQLTLGEKEGAWPLELTTFWRLNKSEEKRINFLISITDQKEQKVYQKILPPSLGLVSSKSWPEQKIIKAVFILNPKNLSDPKDLKEIKLQPLFFSGNYTINTFSSLPTMVFKIKDPELYGEEIIIELNRS